MRVRHIQKSVIPVLVCLAVAGCFKSSEERAADHLQSGIELAAAGDFDRAFVEFRNTLKFDADNLDARREMAQIHMARGAKLQAYRNYLAISEAQPGNVEMHVILGELAFDLNSWDAFTRHATKTSEITEGTVPDDATLVPRIAALDLAAQYRAASLEEDRPLKDALLIQAETQDQDAPGNAVLRKILIDGYVLQGRYDQALGQVEQAIAAAPDDINNYNARLELLVRMEREDEIEAQLRDIIATFPEDVNSKKTLLRYLMSRGETDRAEEFLREVVANSPEGEQRKTAYGDLIAFVLQTSGSDAALTEVDAILADNPIDTFRVLRASILYETGDRAAAISALQTLVATEGSEDSSLTPLELQEAQTLLARMLQIDGNEVGARTLVEQILETDPTAVGALKMRANWLIEADDTDGAIIALRAAMDNAPDDADAITLMAQAYQRAGNTDLMLEFLSLATETTGNAPEESSRYAAALVGQGRLLQAETVLIASLRISPGNVTVLNQLGRLYVQLDDIPRARQVVATLRKINQETATANADAIELELVAREQGADEALQYLETLATREGDTADQAKLAIIRARIANGEGDSALEYAQNLLDEEPDNLNYRYAHALANAALGNYPQAVSLIQALLADHPQTTQAWLQLSRIQLAAGDTDAALTTINQGLDALPQSGDLQWAKASFLQRAGDIDGAIAIFESLYEQNSASLVVANNLASMLTTYRDDGASLDRAKVIARRLAGTQVPALQDTYGWIQHLSGNHDEAIEYLEPAAAALGRDVVVQVHLGMAYAAAGRRDDAIAQLRRALEVGGPLGGNEEVLEGARTKIAELEAAPAADDGQN